MIKVLMILPGLNFSGGIERFAMNYFRKFDHQEFKIDFLVHSLDNDVYTKEISSNGGEVFLFEKFSLKSFKNIANKYREVLKKGSYDIVHCNMANAAFLYLKTAYEEGVKTRIIHSHQERAADKISHALRNIPLLYEGKKYANANFACSKNAGDFLFKNEKYIIIPNLIDYNKYAFNQQIRDEIRKQYKIGDNFVIGHTGRLCPQKNQIFLLKSFIEVLKHDPSAKLLLIGDGEDRDKNIDFINKNSLDNKVYLLGARDDIPDLLQIMDVFAFPSLYEGLSISLLEAQCCSLPCVVSKNIHKSSDISGLIKYVDINNPQLFANKLLETKEKERKEILLDRIYDLNNNKNYLEDIYKELLGN